MNPVILVVEDNSTDEKLTLRALGKSTVAHEIVVTRDGAAALDYLLGRGQYADANRPDLPALVLLDLKLPKIDGLEVLRRIRADDRAKLVPVVILTASREEEDIMEGRVRGANAYVRKPVDFTQFVDAANVIVNFWLRLNEPNPHHRGPT